MWVTNIIPKANSEISMEEYNRGLSALHSAVSVLEPSAKRGVKTGFDSGERSLDEVIPGAVARKWFLEYLRGFPRTFHPSDMAHLDRFTVALFRTRTKVNPHYGRQYLIEDRGWSARDAGIVDERIVAGLQVLGANRRY